MFTTELENVIPHVRAFARMLSGERELADDIVQNACLKAWNARKSFDPSKGSFKSWMFTITRNEFLQHVRKSRPIDCYEPSDLENTLVADCNLGHRAACSEALRQVFALNPEQRDAFILVVAAGYAYEEAAQICKCSVGTIKSRINRARAKLLALRDTEMPVDEDDLSSSVAPHTIRDLMGYVDHLVQTAA